MKRREAREKAFQFLFQIDINNNEPVAAIREYLDEQGQDDFLQTLIEGVTERKTEIDEIIRTQLENWSLERIAAVERTILRIATYEIRYMDDIPPNVSINEAVELGKIYGDEKSGKFVNGVLSNVIIEGGQA